MKIASKKTLWGTASVSGSGVPGDFGFTGHYLDRGTGMNLALYRAYLPALARWLTRDPIGLIGGANLYAYVGNDPINEKDPLGRETCASCFARLRAKYDRCRVRNRCGGPPIVASLSSPPGEQCSDPPDGGGTPEPSPECRNCDYEARMDIADCLEQRGTGEDGKPKVP